MNNNFSVAYEQFFLGLLEGDGSIQVNHWRKKALQFRIVIKLKYDEITYNMCADLRDALGFMNLHVRNNNIILVEDHRNKLKRFIQCVERNRLLVTHRRYQYAFFIYCFQNRITYSEYITIKQHGASWPPYQNIKPYTVDQLLAQPHWPNWVCGFTEAEGCFCVRSNGSLSFSIAQKKDAHLLHAIKKFFQIPNIVRNSQQQIYVVETYRTAVLTFIVNYFCGRECVGLLGIKRKQLEIFRRVLNEKKLKRRTLIPDRKDIS